MCANGHDPKGLDRDGLASWALITLSREEVQVSIGVADDEGAGAPGLCAERLVERDTNSLVFEEQRLGIVESDRCRQEILSVAQLRVDDGSGYAAEIQARTIAHYLAIERRGAIGKRDTEAKFLRIELAGGADIGDEELRLSSKKNGPIELLGVCASH